MTARSASSTLPKNILAIQFKYYGDTIFMTPALQAIKAHYPQANLHVLVAPDKAPLLDGLPFIDKVWAMPRKRRKANMKQTWPFIKQIRATQFDQVVDFGGNDRGAILSFLSGAPIRLSYREQTHNLIRKLAYTQAVDITTLDPAYAKMHLQLLAAWGIEMPDVIQLAIAKPSQTNQDWLPDNTILCHLGTSQAKKEWSLDRWYAFYQLAKKSGHTLVFSAGPDAREQGLLIDFKAMDSSIQTLPKTSSLDAFLSALQQATLFISGDTGPLHFAAALDIPVVGLYGVVNSLKQASPNYAPAEKICVHTCTCTSPALQDMKVCGSVLHCMQSISSAAVLAKVQARLNHII